MTFTPSSSLPSCGRTSFQMHLSLDVMTSARPFPHPWALLRRRSTSGCTCNRLVKLTQMHSKSGFGFSSYSQVVWRKALYEYPYFERAKRLLQLVAAAFSHLELQLQKLAAASRLDSVLSTPRTNTLLSTFAQGVQPIQGPVQVFLLRMIPGILQQVLNIADLITQRTVGRSQQHDTIVVTNVSGLRLVFGCARP